MIYLITSSILLASVLGAGIWIYHQGKIVADDEQRKKLVVTLEKKGRAVGNWIKEADQLSVKGEGLKREAKEIFNNPTTDGVVQLLNKSRSKTPKAKKTRTAA